MARILMADDDRHFTAVVGRFLTRAGHEVLTVPDGSAALAALERFEADVLILDVAMPGLGGDAVAREAKRPTLFLSGRDLDRVTDFEGPHVRFLPKPADLDEILAEVEALLRPAQG